MTLTVGSLFSGVGGLDLGLERAGMTVLWQSEIDPYACRVLNKHWPDVPNLGDVTLIDWTEVPRVDVICGGYPCQPFSVAGRRQGDQDPRHLWPWMLNAVRVLRPRYALLENVAGHLGLGFGRVLGDLAEIGYDCEWDCIPAAAVGAPHRRDRVFALAYPNGRGHGRTQDAQRVGRVDGGDAGPARQRERARPVTLDRSTPQHVADADVDGLQRQPGTQTGRHEVHAHFRADVDGRGADLELADTAGPGRAGPVDTEPAGSAGPVGAGQALFGGRRLPGRQPWWDAEPDVGRVAHGIPARVDRLRTLGNAVVPQVAEHIGRLILEAAA